MRQGHQVPVANETRTAPWGQRHCPSTVLSSITSCDAWNCCNYSLGHFNLKVTDLNSTEQQWAPPSSGSVHPYLIGYLNSMEYIMEYIIFCMVYPYSMEFFCGIYHIFHVIYLKWYIPPYGYTIGISHLTICISHHLPDTYHPKLIHTKPYTT